MSAVHAVMFDLDETLVNTSELAAYRENGNREELRKNINLSKIYPCVTSILKAIKDKKIPLALISNSPRWYIDIILRHHNIEVFDVIISYDDVGRHGKKPSGNGIDKAMATLNLTKENNIIYIGDRDIDFNAAYNCYIKPVAPSWATRVPIDQIPAAILNSKTLIDSLDNFHEISLVADLTAQNKTFNFEKKQLNFIPLNEKGQTVTIADDTKIIALGRYFSQTSSLMAAHHEAHQLSRDIYTKEETESFVFPQYYVDLMVKVIDSLHMYIQEKTTNTFDIITVIPSKKGKNSRLENLLKRIDRKSNLQVNFIADIFEFTDSAPTLKTIGSTSNREKTLQNNLFLKEKYASQLKNKSILIIDDVFTTGSTFRRAFELTRQAGVNFYFGVCLSKTVSFLEKLEPCPLCSSPLIIKKNKKSSIHFIGCSKYRDGCKYKRDIKVGTCPRCNRNLVRKQNKNTKEYFHSCEGYFDKENKCSYTESCTIA